MEQFKIALLENIEYEIEAGESFFVKGNVFCLVLSNIQGIMMCCFLSFGFFFLPDKY